MGNDNQSLGKHDLAVVHLKKALGIKSNSLLPDHPDTGKILANMGDVYMDQKNFEKALSYFEQAANIVGKVFPSSYPCIIEVWKRHSICRVPHLILKRNIKRLDVSGK